jgi:hypothetical protein
MTAIPDLTLEQQRAVEAATKLAPQPWHDGIVSNIAAKLSGDPPYANATVQAAMIAVLTDLGLDTPFLT